MKDLIIVESPAKAKTITNFLKGKYNVIASKGHIRDLPKNKINIEIKDGKFIPNFAITPDHKSVVSDIKKLAKDANTVYIATDEDREGEAIGFHIASILNKDIKTTPRIVFHEITPTAIEHALSHPRTLDMNKVHAQQARRFLDRIVGYKLSPILMTKIQRGLSAGRVQSSALKIIVDKEREILKFVPIVYYSIDCLLNTLDNKVENLEARLIEYKNNKIDKLTIQDEKEANQIVDDLKKSKFHIDNIEIKTRKTSSPPPFMTSTLQQTASNLLGFNPSRTMSAAQKLYEGVPTPNGTMGVITYMRTDSLNIAEIAQSAARELILNKYGKDYLPEVPKKYASKAKGAQEAHEAIRPTLIDFNPDIAKDYLRGDELLVYNLIYKRFIASQMTDAKFESQNLYIKGDNSILKASGVKMLFDGFYKVLGTDDKDKIIPNLNINQEMKLVDCKANRKETEPPNRFSEASLIKTLESLGIGRPSTYAPTISLLTKRNYITIEKKQIKPTPISFKVIEMLEKHFEEIVDSKFTANLENKLDEIAENKVNWENVLWDFYVPFEKKIKDGKDNIVSQKVAIPTGEKCPKCGNELLEREGRFGRFKGCSNYPKCKYILAEKKENTTSTEENVDYGKCDKCGEPMIKKVGKRGPFLACSAYPNCKNTKKLEKKKLEKED